MKKELLGLFVLLLFSFTKAEKRTFEIQLSPITQVTLTFTPSDGGIPITATATDPDGAGPQELAITQNPTLDESADYTLTIALKNTENNTNINDEINAAATAYQFFFAFTDAIFRSPDGDGNMDNRDDSINYNDADENNLPIGLSTSWKTECIENNTSGTFRLLLKHQPDIKSTTSTANDGDTDLDLTFDITVQDDPEAPPCENEEEVIDKITLTFTPKAGGDPITAIASDPDGPGPLDLELEDINLIANREYDLTLGIENTIEGTDISQEIREEDDEHMFFYTWTEGLFANPAGDGNVDSRNDSVNYNDVDENGFPVGLSTNWTTSATMASGTFRLILKHQPGTKSATSTVNDGGTDLDLTWNIGTIISDINNLAKINRKALHLSPNPTSNLIQWHLDNLQLDEVEVRILDQTGRIMLKEINPSFEIPVYSLPQGIYIFQVRSKEQIWNAPFVKI